MNTILQKGPFRSTRGGKRVHKFEEDFDVEKALSDSVEVVGVPNENGFLKKAGEIEVVVCSLIATVSFASAITLPGGFVQDGKDMGMAVLTDNTYFNEFLVFDVIAFLTSIITISIYFGLPFLAVSKKKQRRTLGLCQNIHDHFYICPRYSTIHKRSSRCCTKLYPF